MCCVSFFSSHDYEVIYTEIRNIVWFNGYGEGVPISVDVIIYRCKKCQKIKGHLREKSRGLIRDSLSSSEIEPLLKSKCKQIADYRRGEV